MELLGESRDYSVRSSIWLADERQHGDVLARTRLAGRLRNMSVLCEPWPQSSRCAVEGVKPGIQRMEGFATATSLQTDEAS